MSEHYGVDAPGVVRVLGFSGLAGAIAAGPVYLVLPDPIAVTALSVVALTALTMLVQAGWMLYSSAAGKHHLWRRTLDGLGLRGDERVLEVGPGRGAVLVTAARRIPRGHLVGVDIWRPQDQSGNGPDALLANARSAGVEDRIEVRRGDMRALPYTAPEFDLALAGLAIHNLPPADRPVAVRELLRVLRPGGRLVIVDFQGTTAYAETLRTAGARDVQVSGLQFAMHPPTRIVTATAP
jgi:arsenite methyltransferase